MSLTNRIITPNSEINIIRDSNDHVIKVEEIKDGYTLVTEITRDNDGNAIEFNTERL